MSATTTYRGEPVNEQEAVVYWPVLGGTLIVLAVSLLAMSGYATVARRWLREAGERHQDRRREYLMDRALAEAAASFPGGSYVEEGGR